MKILNPDIDLELFYLRRKEASQKVLLLDYDGTLAPFHKEPNKAEPYAGIREVLNRIMHVPDMRLVIITGRWTKDLIPLLQLETQPEIWGSHGLERLQTDGSYEIDSMEEKHLDGLVAADEWIEELGLSGRCEKKPGCLAIHWRGLDEKTLQELRNLVEPKWSNLAQAWQLSLQEFDGGLELRVPGRDKGDAVGAILAEVNQDAVTAYLGDDLTDEDAFRAIKGKGIGILVREELRPTAADLWIKPPEELLTFLSGWIGED
jgi:trehalose 6-phosphate phosphatase